MEQISEEIEYSKTWNDAVKNRKIGEYEVVVNVAESYDENLYKFDIHVSRDDIEKAQFFMIKRYWTIVGIFFSAFIFSINMKILIIAIQNYKPSSLLKNQFIFKFQLKLQ